MTNAQITVRRDALASAVTFTKMAVPARPSLPVMGGMMLRISGGALAIAAFDYETSVRTQVRGQADGAATILADARSLAAAVQSMPKLKTTQVTVAISTDTLTVACQDFETPVTVLPAEEYPAVPELPGLQGEADAGLFLAAVTRVAAAASTDDTLPMLTNVCLRSSRGELAVAATDRYRLAVDRVPWTGPDRLEILIPAAALVKFAKAADRDGKIAVHLGDGRAAVSDGSSTMITRLCQQTYLEYRPMIRAAGDHDTKITVAAQPLRAALERAVTLCGKDGCASVEATAGGLTVTVLRDGQPVGSQHVTAMVKGPDAHRVFTARYLAGMLAVFDGDVQIGLKTVTESTPLADGSSRDRTIRKPAQVTTRNSRLVAVIASHKGDAS